ncbi:MAG: alpha/beta fold hydrolase [Bdellovibrio sp.]|nr:alpha/beta fold hydrolase [Bdellovibrio sp.]
MFANLLSIHHILKSPNDHLSAFFQLGLQYPERIFYEGIHGTVTYRELTRLTKERCEQQFLTAIASPHPAYFFADCLKALANGKLPLLLSHKYDDAYKTNLINTLGKVDDMPIGQHSMIGVFTSGTSGTPKAVLHGLDGLLWNVLGVLTRWQEELKWQDQFIPTFGLVLPWHHFGGFMVLLRAFVLNAKVIHVQMAEEFALHTHVDVASVVPTQINDILRALDIDTQSSVTSHFLVGGAKSGYLPSAKSHGLSLSLSYGLTETGGTVAATAFGEHTPARPYPYRSLEAHPHNQFTLSGPTLALGYFQNKIWHPFEGALLSPDYGVINQNDGSLTILGRRDGMIICGGENILPEEILATLSSQNAQYVLTAMPDERLGQIPVLFFSPSENMTTSKFIQQVNQDLQSLPSFKRPRKIIPFPPKHHIKGIKPSQDELAQWMIDYEKFRFEDWGNPAGAKILALHGFMGGPHDISQIALHLPEFHWIVPYLPGHGTPIGQFHNFEHGHELLLKWYQELYPQGPFSVLGYSMGGRLALGMVERLLHTDQIEMLQNLILLSTALGLDDEEKCRERRTQDANLALHFLHKEDKRHFLQTWYSGAMWGNLKARSIYSSLIEKRLATPHEEWSKSMLLFGQGNHQSFKQTLGMLSQQHKGCRCYCYGSLDSKYKKFAEDYRRAGFMTKEFPILGHALMEEAPESLGQFLQTVLRH